MSDDAKRPIRQQSKSSPHSVTGSDTPRPNQDTHSAPRATKTPGKISRTFGRYRIIRRLGKGGMGTVFLAEDTQLHREVALKIPHFESDDDHELLERFYREARAAATLNHPNLCPVHDVGEVDGIHYLTMAFIEGRSLSDLVRPGEPLAADEAVAIVQKLALGMAEAHEKGIVHRDLKPSNISMNQRGEPVVMDFGLARRNNSGDARLTKSGAVIGTPAYMPPEQIKGDFDAIGPCCDIYSLGVILYELLTGEIPFDGPIAAVLGQVLTQEPPPPSSFRADLDPRLEVICLKMMAKQIKERYGSMREAATALSDFLKNKGQQSDHATQASFQTVAVANSPRHATVKGEAQRQTLAGQRTATPTSQTVASLRGAVQSASLKFKDAVAHLPGWAKGAIGTVVVMLLIYSISLPFRADRKPLQSEATNDLGKDPIPKLSIDDDKPTPMETDLLATVDLLVHSESKVWRRTNDGVVADNLAGASFLTIPGDVPEEYDLLISLTIKREASGRLAEELKGGFNDTHIGIPADGKLYPFVIRRLKDKTILSFWSPKGYRGVLGQPPLGISIGGDTPFASGCRIVFQIRRSSIRVLLDDKQQFVLDNMSQARSDAGRQVRLGTWQNRVLFHSLVISPPTAPERPPTAIAPFGEPEAKKHQQAWAKHLGADVETTNSIGMKMLLIPPGEFTMGSPDSDNDAADDEKPQHLVKITKPFHLSVYEITQQQYAKVMGTRPWQGKQYVQDGPDYPATYVTWHDAVEFCRKLSETEGVDYHLPTDAILFGTEFAPWFWQYTKLPK